MERCGAYLADRNSLEPNLADSVVNLAARQGDANLFERFLEAARTAGTPQERRRFLMALGEFREPGLVKRALSLSLTDTVDTQASNARRRPGTGVLASRSQPSPHSVPETMA